MNYDSKTSALKGNIKILQKHMKTLSFTNVLWRKCGHIRRRINYKHTLNFNDSIRETEYEMVYSTNLFYSIFNVMAIKLKM